MERTCRICSEPIPVARYEANPIVKTCSPACSYGSGWAAGKDKLAFEVEAVKDNAHGAGCGCRPCALVRLVLGGCRCHVHERGRSR